MKKQDINNINSILNEKYGGEWVINIVDGYLPQGTHKAYQSGYTLKIGESEAQVDEGIRGKNVPFNARVEGTKVYLRYT